MALNTIDKQQLYESIIKELKRNSESKCWDSGTKSFDFGKIADKFHVSKEYVTEVYLDYKKSDAKKLEDIIPIRTEPIVNVKTQQKIAIKKHIHDPNIGARYKDSIETNLAVTNTELCRTNVNVMSSSLTKLGIPLTKENITILNTLIQNNFQQMVLDTIVSNEDKFHKITIKIGTVLKVIDYPLSNYRKLAITTDIKPIDYPDEVVIDDEASCVNPLCNHIGQIKMEQPDGTNLYHCTECCVSYNWRTQRIK